MASIERRIEELEAALEERTKKPNHEIKAQLEALMMGADNGDGELENGGKRGNDSLSSPTFWNQRKMPRWQTRFLECFGPAIYQDGSWHWPEYRGTQQHPDFTPLP